MKKKIFHWLLFFLIAPPLASAQTPRFSAYQTHSSVPYSNINDILEDSLGFLWIATENGLVKFDGYDYTQYRQNSQDKHSLPNNNCRTLLADQRAHLWVGTDNGIVRFNYETGDFKVIHVPNISNNNIVSLSRDTDGTIWMQTFSEVAHLSENGDVLHIYPFLYGVCMEMDEECIWLGSISQGLFKMDKKNGEVVHVSKVGEVPISSVRTIKKFSDGRVAVGTCSDGLVIFPPSMKDSEHYTSSNSVFFKSNYILTVFEDSKHRVWIGSVNGKLVQYDLNEKKLSLPDFKYPSGVDVLTIGTVYEDSHENLWVGTHHYWLFQSNKTINNIAVYQHKEDDSHSISHNAVTCFASDDKHLYVGTDGGGLNIYDKATKRFRTDRRFGNVVIDIKKGSKGSEYWLATWGEQSVGLARFSSISEEIKKYRYDSSDSNSVTTWALRALMVDKDDVWVATDGGGICRIDTKEDSVHNKYNSEESIFSTALPQWTNHMTKDSKGRIWVCSSEGLFVYENGECHRKKIASDDESNVQNEVKMAIELQDGSILVATASNGLQLYDENQSSFSNFSIENNLPSTISSVCQDSIGNLWMSSGEEIICYCTESHDVYRYNIKNDLNGSPFTTNAIFAEKNRIFIGSNHGFFAFSPSELPKTSKPLNVYLKSLSIRGELQNVSDSSILKKTLAYTDTLILQANQNTFSIDYFSIDLEDPDNLSYSYQLEGLQKEWFDAKNIRTAYFTNLSNGEYRFNLRVNRMGSSDYFYSKPLVIIILPPWWKTWWFRAFLILLIIFSSWAIVKKREHEIRRKQKMLEHEVELRTEELRMKNREIEEQKSLLEIQNEKLDESLKTKNKILSVIAHDLRNPLTALVGNLSLMKEQVGENEQLSKIVSVHRSAKELQTQMENLLDWARIQNQNILYTPKDCFLDALTKECLSVMQATAHEKEIVVEFKSDARTSAFIDQRMIGSVIRNLFSNAVKFSHRGGRIDISVKEASDKIVWAITDYGVGMSEEQLRQVFDKDNTLSTFGTDNEKGSGLGMKICKEFVEKNLGKILIKSETSHGTAVEVYLPKGRLTRTDAKTTEFTDRPEVSSNKEKKQTLLVVDDNSEIIVFLKSLFEPQYNALCSTNGEEAYEIARKEMPDLILSDVVMPVMNGMELCRKIKSDTLTRHIPFIMLTSEDGVDNQVDGLGIGADDYITKPFNEQLLMAKVSSTLRNVELRRSSLRAKILRMPEIEIPETEGDVFLRKVNETIKGHLSDEKFDVDFLAESVCLSRVQLFRKMKSVTGCSPSEYIKAMRLESAAQLLKEGGFSIAEVAYNVGFSDPKYFGICFTEKFGMSPSNYSKKHCNGSRS